MTDTIVFGMAPSWLKKGGKCKSLDRLAEWAEQAGMSKFEFHNVIQFPVDTPNRKDVDWELLAEKAKGKKKVVALGLFVSEVLKKAGIEHYRISHPSARNRQFNDPSHEPRMLEGLKEYIHGKVRQFDEGKAQVKTGSRGGDDHRRQQRPRRI